MAIDGPEHLLLVARALGPEVHGDDTQAVERVEEDRGHQAVLEQRDDRRLVRGDDVVVRLGGDADESGVQDVYEQEEEDEDAGDSMSHPGPHSFPAAVQRSSRHGRTLRERGLGPAGLRCRSGPAGYGPPAPAIVATICRFARAGSIRCDQTGNQTASDGLSGSPGDV